MNGDLIIVYVTCPVDSAESIAEKLVDSRLAACVNILPVNSVYVWQDKLCKDNESLLIIKSTAAIFEKLETQVRQIHPYDLPEIVALKAEAVNHEYLKWVHEQTLPTE